MKIERERGRRSGGGEDPARDPGLSRQHLDEAPELHPAADDLGDPVEHLGRVTAGLALEAHDERDLLGVVALHAACHHHESVVERDAELLVLEHAAKLGLRRLDRAVDHDAESAHRRVTGAHGAGEHVEVVCELLLERPPHLRDPARHEPARHERRCETDEQAPERLEDDRARDRGEDAADDRPACDRERREAEAAELDIRLEPLPPALAADRALRGVGEHRGDLGTPHPRLLLARHRDVLRHAPPERAVANVDRREDRETDERENRDDHEDHQPRRRDDVVDPASSRTCPAA